MQRVVRILRAYWKAIVALTVAGGLVGLAWSAVQPRVYTADASGYVAAVASDGSTGAALAGDQLALSKVKSFIDMGYWRSVAETAKTDLGLTDSPEALVQRVKVSNPVDTVNVRVDATGPTPESARDLAEAWLRGMTAEVDQLQSGGGGQSAVRLIAGDSARLPTAPSSPNVKLDISIGALIGAVAGVVFALVRRAFDRRIRSASDITGPSPRRWSASSPSTKTWPRGVPCSPSTTSETDAVRSPIRRRCGSCGRTCSTSTSTGPPG